MTDDLIDGFYREGAPIQDTKAPGGPIEQRWSKRKFEAKLVNPANRRKLSVISVGTGLAGGAAAATLGEAGYQRAMQQYTEERYVKEVEALYNKLLIEKRII